MASRRGPDSHGSGGRLQNVSVTEIDSRGLSRNGVDSLAPNNPLGVNYLAPEALRHQLVVRIAFNEFDSFRAHQVLVQQQLTDD